MENNRHIWTFRDKAMGWLTDFHTKLKEQLERNQQDPATKLSTIQEEVGGAYFEYVFMEFYIWEVHIKT